VLTLIETKYRVGNLFNYQINSQAPSSSIVLHAYNFTRKSYLYNAHLYSS